MFSLSLFFRLEKLLLPKAMSILYLYCLKKSIHQIFPSLDLGCSIACTSSMTPHSNYLGKKCIGNFSSCIDFVILLKMTWDELWGIVFQYILQIQEHKTSSIQPNSRPDSFLLLVLGQTMLHLQWPRFYLSLLSSYLDQMTLSCRTRWQIHLWLQGLVLLTAQKLDCVEVFDYVHSFFL